MTDAMRFEPGTISVPAGKAVTFVVRNAGLVVHELFVGGEADQAAHAVEMAEHPGGSHAHGNAVRVPAAGSESLTMTFDKPGRVLLGCHEPGHYLAGMVGTLEVTE